MLIRDWIKKIKDRKEDDVLNERVKALAVLRKWPAFNHEFQGLGIIQGLIEDELIERRK